LAKVANRFYAKGFDFMFPRSSGILMHISSLPGDYGIGSLGQDARHFVDFLHKAGESYWQILPLVPPGEGASPYMSPSSAAGNPLFIDLPTLVEEGLLTWEDLAPYRYYDVDRVDYAWVEEVHGMLLQRAYRNAGPDVLAQVEDFIARDAEELPDFALFCACRSYFGCPLTEWPDQALVRREPEALAHYRDLLSDEIGYHAFCQYEFARQWEALKHYANDRGIKIIGDIPFYVSPDSVDVWCHPEMFRVDQNTRRANFVSGVPADMFSATGQLWGNPLYDWEAHEKDHYRWWCNRIRRSNAFYDVIRIDHFRAFHSYWEVPKGCTALEGCWRPGPGMKLLKAIEKDVPTAEFIAEDLGDISEEVYLFIQSTGLPGMRILVDAFNDLGGYSSFLPHHCIPDAVMYTGTHDTPTFMQWLRELATHDQRSYAWRYLQLDEQRGVNWGALAGAWGSVCSLAMATMQDVLGLGGDARMNTPGTMGDHNWSWRVRCEALNDGVAGKLRELNWLYGRLR
jgi:4-alpha-glucanotransferase